MLSKNPAAYDDDPMISISQGRPSSDLIFRQSTSRYSVDVAFADLSDACLADAKLFRLRGREVQLSRAYCSRTVLEEARLDGAHCFAIKLHGANLVSASLKNADLSTAQFQEALLQEAHLEGANLEGANFTKANLANTYFQGTNFDNEALQSIVRGLRWRDNNNFDDGAKQALEQLAMIRARAYCQGSSPLS